MISSASRSAAVRSVYLENIVEPAVIVRAPGAGVLKLGKPSAVFSEFAR